MQNRAMLDPVSALIDFANPHQPQGPRLRHAFGAPRQVLVAHQLDAVRAVLDAVQHAAEQGAWCVGYVRYEAAPAFDTALTVHASEGPLIWFGVYDVALPWPQSAEVGSEVEVAWQSGLPRAEFDYALTRIHADIAAGAYYQVNLTAPMQGRITPAASGAPTAAAFPAPETASFAATQATAAPAQTLFAALQRAQPGGYAAYLDTGAEQILSVSPELFFDWRDGTLLTRPMKGTAARGATPEEDAAQAQALQTSAKERAENVMIVDLLRNDLSRIAEPFSVQVPRLFHAEALPSVWQMTSDVTARTRAGVGLAEVFGALFPCGSVTGAPKAAAMQAIRVLESGPRGVYCGALGVVQPGGVATFNVPIRTVTVQGAVARCGIGSGITAGSTAQAEWDEWMHKQAFVRRASSVFDVLETLGLHAGQFHAVDAHLQRMASAAAHFGYPWNADAARGALQALLPVHAQGDWRVRLLLQSNGTVAAQAYALPASPARVRLQLATQPMEQADSEFVRFKTTHRAHYDAFTSTQPEVFDTVLWNAQGEITECTRGNVAMLLRGQWVTPPLRCGLLPGVGRAKALADGRVKEAVVHVAELADVAQWAFVNSLRGWIAADLVGAPITSEDAGWQRVLRR